MGQMGKTWDTAKHFSLLWRTRGGGEPCEGDRADEQHWVLTPPLPKVPRTPPGVLRRWPLWHFNFSEKSARAHCHYSALRVRKMWVWNPEFTYNQVTSTHHHSHYPAQKPSTSLVTQKNVQDNRENSRWAALLTTPTYSTFSTCSQRNCRESLPNTCVLGTVLL